MESLKSVLNDNTTQLLGNKATLLLWGKHKYYTNVGRSNQPSTKCDFQTLQGVRYWIVKPFSRSAQ